MFVFFFFAIQLGPRQHVIAQNGIPDQTGGIYTLYFRPKLQNLYPFSDQKCLKTVPFGAAHTCKAYIWEYVVRGAYWPVGKNRRALLRRTLPTTTRRKKVGIATWWGLIRCASQKSKARTGIEPAVFGLRDQRLTTWPPRLSTHVVDKALEFQPAQCTREFACQLTNRRKLHRGLSFEDLAQKGVDLGIVRLIGSCRIRKKEKAGLERPTHGNARASRVRKELGHFRRPVVWFMQPLHLAWHKRIVIVLTVRRPAAESPRDGQCVGLGPPWGCGGRVLENTNPHVSPGLPQPPPTAVSPPVRASHPKKICQHHRLASVILIAASLPVCQSFGADTSRCREHVSRIGCSRAATDVKRPVKYR